MMKIIIILSLTVLSCKAQIIPVEEYRNYIDNEIEIPDGAYIKDVNNLLDKYEGTWIGNYDNKTYEFIIIKVIYQSNIRPLTIDELRLRYKITDANGNIIEDTTFLSEESPLVVDGYYLSNTSNFYVLSYIGQESLCGQQGDLFIAVGYNNDNDIMKASLSVIGDMILRSDCPNGEVEQILPTEQFTLTKQ